MKCCVLGSGTWGSALAQVLSDNSNEVIIYGRDVEEVSDINNNHPVFCKLPRKILEN